MTRLKEPTQTRYVEPEAHVEEPERRHVALALSWVLFAATLLGLVASASIQGGGIHGWFWALAAVPGFFLALATVLTLRAARRGNRPSER